MKTQIFNLIILDESGSMSCVTKQTISGCNETLDTIRIMQEKFNETQEHFVSIYAFQTGRPSRYIIKNVPVNAVKNITASDYEPYGGTPLYDAIGCTLSDLKVSVKKYVDGIASVTIITDGYENSSRLYNRENVALMIDSLKELGWNFNFIGANIDVQMVSHSLNIDNAMAFEQDEAGTQAMFERERLSRMAYYDRLDEADSHILEFCASRDAAEIPKEKMEELRNERLKLRKHASNNYFKKGKSDTQQE